MAEALLRVCNVCKRYGPVRALEDVSADFYEGEIHAVLGENGAGKSTLMSVLGGFVAPDSGTVALKDGSWPLGQPFAVKAKGLAMVHQHFMLVPEFTVLENLSLVNLNGTLKPLDCKHLVGQSLELAQTLGWDIRPEAKAKDLPVGIQQRVEILKALSSNPRILILDEPTAVLTPEEVANLQSVLLKLKAQGVTILLIAHKLSEVTALCDRVTVLRQGRLVATSLLSETNVHQLADWMVGERSPAQRKPAAQAGEAVLTCQNLKVRGDRGEAAIRGLSFEVRKGEVLAFGGVDGNGQIELAEALVGIRRLESGSVEFRATAIGYIPQDRHQDGLALELSISDNLLIGGRHEFAKPARISEWATGVVRRFGIKIGGLSDPAKSLSGGNQQKVIVGRILDQNPDFIVAVNPTRGLDLKATAFVLESLNAAKAAGAAVILISTDQDEIDALADRTLYLGRGHAFASMAEAVR